MILFQESESENTLQRPEKLLNLWEIMAEISVKIGVGIKQEFKQAATLARQPRNAEISTNETQAHPASTNHNPAFGPICNFSASSA